MNSFNKLTPKHYTDAAVDAAIERAEAFRHFRRLDNAWLRHFKAQDITTQQLNHLSGAVTCVQDRVTREGNTAWNMITWAIEAARM